MWEGSKAASTHHQHSSPKLGGPGDMRPLNQARDRPGIVISIVHRHKSSAQGRAGWRQGKWGKAQPSGAD
jgi:hypothetical protein